MSSRHWLPCAGVAGDEPAPTVTAPAPAEPTSSAGYVGTGNDEPVSKAENAFAPFVEGT